MVNLGNKTVFDYTCRDKCIKKKKKLFLTAFGRNLDSCRLYLAPRVPKHFLLFFFQRGKSSASPSEAQGRAQRGGPFVNRLGSGSRAHTNQGSSQNLLFIRSWSLMVFCWTIHGLELDHFGWGCWKNWTGESFFSVTSFSP